MFAGLNEARQQFNKWQGRAAIFIDFEDKRAWTEVSSIPEYPYDSVIFLIGKGDLYSRDDSYQETTINGLAQLKYNKHLSGWDKDQLEDNDLFAKYLYYN